MWNGNRLAVLIRVDMIKPKFKVYFFGDRREVWHLIIRIRRDSWGPNWLLTWQRSGDGEGEKKYK